MSGDYLLQVMKPARYIGEEWNVSRKDFAPCEVKFALCFPDLYEVGMSNLGVRIIYDILNKEPQVVCERFFAPASDMENILRSRQEEIPSLESKKPLKEFDIIGFSLGSELDYTNVLNIMDLGNIPLTSVSRDENWPLVVGAGPCALNPEPMHAFFDLFFIGEAEEAVLEFIGLYQKYKKRFKKGEVSKEELLLLFSGIEGFYAPSLYEVDYNQDGSIKQFKPKVKGALLKIRKRFVRDLNSAPFPCDWLVPYIQVIHDRVTVEVMRGCPNRCRFCQARSQYFPLRYREEKNVLKLASELIKRTGYEEISLTGLSVSDYPKIEELLGKLVAEFKARAIGISLPSVKAKTILGNVSGLIATIKKTGLTFAPEAGSQRLREILAKDFNEEEFFQALEEAYAFGYQHVKLYFMVGLPEEAESDLEAVIDFAARVSAARRKTNPGPAQVNVSVNTLIPKPHTPFQWLGMRDLDYQKQAQDLLKDKARRNRRIALSFHNRYMSFVEGILSRGDRKLSEVIHYAFKKGARFDAWSNYFSFDIWMAAFRDANIDPDFYLKTRQTDEILPWDFIDVGIDKEALKQEAEKVKKVLI